MSKKEIIAKLNDIVPISLPMRALLEQLTERELIIKLEEYTEWVKNPIIKFDGGEGR